MDDPNLSEPTASGTLKRNAGRARTRELHGSNGRRWLSVAAGWPLPREFRRSAIEIVTLSLASFRRTVAAFSVYAAGGIAAFVWKVLRDGPAFESYPISPWLVGVMPNLLPAAVLPALIFIRPKSVRFKEYVSIVLAILFALIAYEIAQLWMPSRTFDVADIVATILGAVLGCLLCWLIFFGWLGSRSNTDPIH